MLGAGQPALEPTEPTEKNVAFRQPEQAAPRDRHPQKQVAQVGPELEEQTGSTRDTAGCETARAT